MADTAYVIVLLNNFLVIEHMVIFILSTYNALMYVLKRY